ncbi:type II toxin-antitoxin system Phd/YefM family antitoxin [Sphingomonas sp. SUN019]|uniref:type II toxin-antitoxin system Phd/YefM family antitoxin n=1 Tax=Sphingomonas sp. SUN019 TaxID=2937788 RepID=UPI002164119B|nr:type II toxin-antitoxin system Phd/YefM family antitoxin [Sphingomonas sp. SUN019]UVO50409.1 type II toxin-antitoxin system Phd/YefM family antitoxin [Sphingomonas sp. SUN019]
MGKMVPATEFKAKCLGLIDEMERNGESLTITRRGKASITLMAQREQAPRIASIFGCMKGTFTVHGNLDEPIDPDWEAKWEAKWDERGLPAPPGDQR